MWFIIRIWHRVVKEREDVRRKELGEALRKTLSESFGEYYEKTDTELADKTGYIFRDLRNYLVHYSALQTKPEIDQANAPGFLRTHPLTSSRIAD